MATIEKLYPEYIRRDGDTQPRAKIDQAVCKDYHERMKAGETFPAIDVYFDGKDYWLADGFHRIQAYALALPGEPIDCNVFEGTVQDAQWHSYSVNKTHGLQRTNDDKARAVKAALAHPRAERKSNVEIAEHCGVDEKTVRKYRRPGNSTTERPQSAQHRPNPTTTSEIPKSRPRKGRDGRTINTARIGKGQQRRAQRPLTPSEYSEARRTGRMVRHPGSMVKLELPDNNTTNCAYDLLSHFTFEYLERVFSEIVRLNQERQQQEKAS